MLSFFAYATSIPWIRIEQSRARHSTAAAKPILEIPKELWALASMRFRCGAIEKKKKKKTILSQQSSKCQPQLWCPSHHTAHKHAFIIYVFIRSYRISQFLPCTDKINEGEYIDRTHIYVLQYRFICAYAYRLVSFFFRMEFFFFLYVAASNEP